MARRAKPRPATPSQAKLIDELKAAAEQIGIRIREEKLLREVGYRVRSGTCRLEGDEILFLDRRLPPSSQIDILVEELARRCVDDIYLTPAAREMVERAAARGAPEDGGRAGVR